MSRDSSAMPQLAAAPVTDTVAELGESPLWDDEAGLRWLDVPGRRLFTLTPDGRESAVALPETVTAIELCRDSRLLAVTGRGFGALHPATGHVDEHVRVLADDGISMNDGAVDVTGACWAGSAVRNGSRRGALYRFDGTHVSTQLDRLGMSNGLDWSPAANLLYHVDTSTGSITAWDCDVTTGTLGGGRLLCSIPDNVGLPDGLTVDSSGDVWLAIWGRGEVWRIDAATGDTTAVVSVPTRYPTSCVFGGSSLSTLFITSAAHENAPGGGRVYAVEVPAKGRVAHRFSGELR